MMSITFKAELPSRDVTVLRANCPYCGAIYWEETHMDLTPDATARWHTRMSSHTCKHFRGVCERTDRVLFEQSWWERFLDLLDQPEVREW